MLKDEVIRELDRKTFIPLRLHLQDGRKMRIPFRESAHILGNWGVLVLIGMKEGTRTAKGYDRCTFDYIVRIEKLPKGRARRKAS
jgi:hypothetical protein